MYLSQMDLFEFVQFPSRLMGAGLVLAHGHFYTFCFVRVQILAIGPVHASSSLTRTLRATMINRIVRRSEPTVQGERDFVQTWLRKAVPKFGVDR